MILTYRYRVKSCTGELNRQSRAVNFVWNFCNDRQKDALRYGRPWLTAFNLGRLTSGSSTELRLHSHTIEAICRKYVHSRQIKNKPFLRYRSVKRSLKWVPLSGASIKPVEGGFRFSGHVYSVFDSRKLPEGKIKDGSSFSCDSLGRWFLNICIEVDDMGAAPKATAEVGIDLGLKDFATFSTGERIEAQRIYRNSERSLVVAQKANKKRRVASIQIKVGNQRRDFHHKHAATIAKRFALIVVGNVNASALAKTNMSKSVLDAGWSSFRNMLAYKAIRHGARYLEVDERFTSQTCSNCGLLPDSRPKGIAGLGIREWVCSDCGAVHDRDTNAAMNILRRGRATLAAGILASNAGERQGVSMVLN